MAKQIHEKADIKGDRLNIMLLLLMYSFQGIVYGLTLALPIIFQNRNVSYAEQAEFSLTGYPYCFKLLWAPIVDCVFFKRFGRRKTWIIPTQYLMGLTLLFSSMNLDNWLGNENSTLKPNIRLLTVTFFLCILFSAIQDVSVDGWALTMLQKRNLGYAGTCQSVGSITGQFVAYVGFIILDSKDFCNTFRSVPKDHGFVSFTQFIFFWSMVLLISNTFILIFKKDNSLEVIDDENCECRLGLMESYEHLWSILKLESIIMLSIVLLTFYVGFGASMGVAHLKMIDAGISKESFVLLTLPAIPCQVILSVVLRRGTTGPQSINYFIRFYVILWVTGILLAVVLYFLPFVKNEQKVLPSWYYGVLFFVYNARTVSKGLMGLSVGSFFFRVSDPRYGGIYLTLLNTMTNIGVSWPTTLCLWAVDSLTITHCDATTTAKNCETVLDGFYTETVIFSVIGVLWLLWGRNVSLKLQKLESSAWMLESKEVEMVQYEVLPVLIDTTVK